MALENGTENKVECSQCVTNRSYRANQILSECTNQIVIALEMAEKIVKYVCNRSSFITISSPITKYESQLRSVDH